VALARERAESRRLRAEVTRLKGCLGVLPELARHLIEMRAGVDGPAMTRRAAAKELNIGVARARRIERRGLRTMRRASRNGVCGTAGGTTPATDTGFRSETASAALIRPVSSVTAAAPAAGPSQQAKEPARQGVGGVTATSPPPAPKPGPLPGSRVAVSAPGGHGHTLVISLVLLLLAANLLAGGVWLLRRRNDRQSLAAATGQRRPYADPGHELRFGRDQSETPERPDGADTPAGANRRDSG
jgi:hypothetical protein